MNRQNGELTTVDNPEEAAWNEYLDLQDDLHARRTPRPNGDGVTVAGACNPFQDAKKDRGNSAALSAATFRDYFETCKRLTTLFGRDRTVDDSTPSNGLSSNAKLAFCASTRPTLRYEVRGPMTRRASGRGTLCRKNARDWHHKHNSVSVSQYAPPHCRLS